ncbi:MAG: hypothetical protein K2Y28_06140 [Burkholderiaceae bacterium]|nr:hypothetical protein [Burkholderiaceae bacterium]
MKKPFVITLIVGFGLINTSGCLAVTPEIACAVWSSMARAMAEGRDSGVPYKEQQRKIEGSRGKSGVTNSNLAYAYGILSIVYQDFPKKTPGDLALLVNTACVLQNSK